MLKAHEIKLKPDRPSIMIIGQVKIQRQTYERMARAKKMIKNFPVLSAIGQIRAKSGK